MQLNPARGRKLTPNDMSIRTWLTGMVYAAQPREGTETVRKAPCKPSGAHIRFMQLNPARGRKQLNFWLKIELLV